MKRINRNTNKNKRKETEAYGKRTTEMRNLTTRTVEQQTDVLTRSPRGRCNLYELKKIEYE
ncbi:hypothetical protein C8N47_11959 [Mangrovibacterium marinum]|uniref:Uncharacterized protein n=1 Tax=Mangrovibacterium marinum TaxID=1639118 RepID=A0A2T5BYP5_9BACT|nr:hypothetical protein C8N47_11959 [Mangrovibacterium marinum]